MLVAFTNWNRRIAPVFDVATHVKVLDEKTEVVGEFGLPKGGGVAKIRFLREIGVTVLVCGGISSHLLHLACNSGMEIVPFVSGEIEQVIFQYRLGTLQGYTMPGCKHNAVE